MLALSVSISTSSSPRLTSSPSDFSHLRIVPSSIESDRRGIATSAMGSGYKAPARGAASLPAGDPSLGGAPEREHLAQRRGSVGDRRQRRGLGRRGERRAA